MPLGVHVTEQRPFYNAGTTPSSPEIDKYQPATINHFLIIFISFNIFNHFAATFF
jgi:hypothetical protein